MKTTTRVLLLLCAAFILVLACIGPRGASVEEKRQYVRNMRDESRRRFEEADPGIVDRVRAAYGYAVFSNLSTKYFLFSPGQGYGIAVVNGTGQETFMRMAQLGMGPGVGVVNQTVLFVFPGSTAFDRGLTAFRPPAHHPAHCPRRRHLSIAASMIVPVSSE